MTLQELKTLVRKGEGQHLEFKKKAAHPEKIVREMAAFANSDGGKLLIGVSDNKEISGLKFPDEEHYVMEAALLHHTDPEINYNLEVIDLPDGKAILSYDIPPSELRPHYFFEKKEEGAKKVYVRVKDQSLQASKEMREIIRRRNSERDVQFYFSQKEKLLMGYLEENNSITIDQFQEIAKIGRYMASRTLVLLVLANVLDILPSKPEDLYVLKPV